jgi:hypothetical protein
MSGQWLIQAINGHQLSEGTNLIAMNAKDLPKLVNMALRSRDKQSKHTGELFLLIKDINLGPNTENWRVLNAQLKDEK